MKDMKDEIERKLLADNYTYFITFDRCRDRHIIEVKTEDDDEMYKILEETQEIKKTPKKKSTKKKGTKKKGD